MADPGADNPPLSAQTSDAVRPARRQHTYSRLTTALTVLALAAAVYGLWRLDSIRDRLDEIDVATRALESERTFLRAELKSIEERSQQARDELVRRLAALDDVPKQLQELASATEELRGRAEGPERAWSRAEAMYLLELAQRRLALNRDVDTAIVALESADARLASLRDASFAPVRQQIARELQALRGVQQPDITGISARLASLEERATHLPVKGIVATERADARNEELPTSFLPRAWAIARGSIADLIRVRKVDDAAGGIVTKEEALLRREHLRLLLFSARAALARNDDIAYRDALASARTWLGQSFDVAQPSAYAALNEIRALEPIEIDPPLPDISGSSAALRRLMPRGSLPAVPE
ncbi:MAG: hypothetical protein GX535_11575 [Xanthomonadaceae bacterium]|nr:hypothetical protein [Xanthomonadaceae bacterium]